MCWFYVNADGLPVMLQVLESLGDQPSDNGLHCRLHCTQHRICIFTAPVVKYMLLECDLFYWSAQKRTKYRKVDLGLS